LQKKVFDGTIDYLQVLDENGTADPELMPASIDGAKALEMYRYMAFARALDAKALSLQRQGRIATYAPLLGQEATQIGAALAMRKEDYFVPNFRQHGVFLARGGKLSDFFLSWKGFEDGNKISKETRVLPVAVPVGTQIPHSVGLAFAQKYLKTGAAVVVFVGDGGTSEGDFYEGLNFAGVFKVPLVIVIEDNQWAISEPRAQQSAAATLAQKAIAAGIKGLQVDGNDVFGVYKAVSDAIADAGNGPVVIECLTYRMSMHTTADDPTKYRKDAEVEEWKKRDPIDRLSKYLSAKGIFTEDTAKKMADEQAGEIDSAIQEVETAFKPDPKSMFNNIYSFVPDILKEELDDAEKAGFWQ
jgi:pyruvate dehydrogenase E1 component alpha subunit